MLFSNVDVFMLVLKDFAIQEGFEIVQTRNERSRVSAYYTGKG